MNIVCIPYHDWRKIEEEGSRTRDSHIISHLFKNENIDTCIIINRPITYSELYLKKKNKSIKGEKLFSFEKGSLYKLNHNNYVFDYISADLIGPLIKKKKWFFDAFEDDGFLKAFKKCTEFLGVNIDVIYNQNIFASAFIKKMSIPTVFDGWDNFLLFPENLHLRKDFLTAYQSLAISAKIWTTNSVKNVEYYGIHYGIKDCILIRNGVDVERFQKTYDKPEDLSNIKSPIIGFGGKITHLFDYDLFNYSVLMNPDKSFVIVGQILDNAVFSKILKAENLHYLGDKSYEEYCSYVTNFDLGIIPYVTNKLEHGADSIKMYEYLASGLNVVGTPGAGMNDLSSYIYISEDKEKFSLNINKALKGKQEIKLPDFHTWNFKTDQTIDAFNQVLNLTQ